MYDHDDDLYDDEDTQKDKYLTFDVAGESYAIDIRFVIEIIGIQRITPVPDTEPYVRGIINLRGTIIPVVDVRLRFGMPERAYSERTCIVIVETVDDAGERSAQVGLIVDAVSEVLDLPDDRIVPPPATGRSSRGRFLRGIGRDGDSVKLILDTQILLADDAIDVAHPA